MFTKEGVPFFVIAIPFICLILSSYFIVSYYLKISQEQSASDIKYYKEYIQKNKNEDYKDKFIAFKNKNLLEKQDKFIHFVIVISVTLLVFLTIFTILMSSIINNIVNKYLKQVENKETALEEINKNLEYKIQRGIKEGQVKNKMILQQSKLSIMGSMLSTIAHQWRQPLSELTGVLMELEVATNFKKVDENHILNSLKRSNNLIDYMSNTIDDFRNFYQPDKIKEKFFAGVACKKALKIIDATLKNLDIYVDLHIQNDKEILGYPREYSQVILNIITNVKDSVMERNTRNAKICITINSIDNRSIVVIKDNAGGIDEKNLDFIFDPYFSTKKSSKGTGIGLYISKLIIEKNMNGELSVNNDKNGAVFTIAIG